MSLDCSDWLIIELCLKRPEYFRSRVFGEVETTLLSVMQNTVQITVGTNHS